MLEEQLERYKQQLQTEQRTTRGGRPPLPFKQTATATHRLVWTQRHSGTFADRRPCVHEHDPARPQPPSPRPPTVRPKTACSARPAIAYSRARPESAPAAPTRRRSAGAQRSSSRNGAASRQTDGPAQEGDAADVPMPEADGGRFSALSPRGFYDCRSREHTWSDRRTARDKKNHESLLAEHGAEGPGQRWVGTSEARRRCRSAQRRREAKAAKVQGWTMELAKGVARVAEDGTLCIEQAEDDSGSLWCSIVEPKDPRPHGSGAAEAADWGPRRAHANAAWRVYRCRQGATKDAVRRGAGVGLASARAAGGSLRRGECRPPDAHAQRLAEQERKGLGPRGMRKQAEARSTEHLRTRREVLRLATADISPRLSRKTQAGPAAIPARHRALGHRVEPEHPAKGDRLATFTHNFARDDDGSWNCAGPGGQRLWLDIGPGCLLMLRE